MDLFLDDSNKGFFLDLLANYLQLVKSKKVKPIRLSSETLKLVSDKEITFPNLPLLVESSTKKYSNALSISLALLEHSFSKDLLVGTKKEDYQAVTSMHCE
jgi:hypothetical protein